LKTTIKDECIKSNADETHGIIEAVDKDNQAQQTTSENQVLLNLESKLDLGSKTEVIVVCLLHICFVCLLHICDQKLYTIPIYDQKLYTRN